jgi:hypothetical protein
MADEDSWIADFKITVDDLQRLENWLVEHNRCASLEELTRRIIRGRLRHGRDTSRSALPGWVIERKVLSWDEQEQWCVGCLVLVARTIEKVVTPFFGVIEEIDEERYSIRIGNDVILYKHVRPGSEEAKVYFKYLRKSIWEQEKQKGSEEDQINNAVLKYGARIASELQAALENNPSFVTGGRSWCLQQCIPEVPKESVKIAYRALVKTKAIITLLQLLERFPDLPQDEMGEIALDQALPGVPQWFRPCEGGWQLAPPPWDKAVGSYYVYDPETYDILLEPGQRLTKKKAERLMALGFYDQTVEAEDWP